MMSFSDSKIKPGQTWRWNTPTGDVREMKIYYILPSPFGARAFGQTRSGKRITVTLQRLRKGLDGATMVDFDEKFVYLPKRPR